MAILKEQTLAIAIDLQERLVPVMHEAEFLMRRAEILTQGLHILDVPIFITRQYPKGLGDTLPSITNAAPKATTYDKIDYSVYRDSAIQEAIDATNKKTIILYGVEAHICVLQTALDLKEAGYHVYVVVDACASRHTYDRDIAWRRLEQEGIVLTTSESLLFALLGRAGSEEFKTISKLIK